MEQGVVHSQRSSCYHSVAQQRNKTLTWSSNILLQAIIGDTLLLSRSHAFGQAKKHQTKTHVLDSQEMGSCASQVLAGSACARDFTVYKHLGHEHNAMLHKPRAEHHVSLPEHSETLPELCRGAWRLRPCCRNKGHSCAGPAGMKSEVRASSVSVSLLATLFTPTAMTRYSKESTCTTHDQVLQKEQVQWHSKLWRDFVLFECSCGGQG